MVVFLYVVGFMVFANSLSCCVYGVLMFLFFFQAEDGIRDLVRSRGLGDVYKRQDVSSFPGRYNPTLGRPGWCFLVLAGLGVACGVVLSLIHI